MVKVRLKDGVTFNLLIPARSGHVQQQQTPPTAETRHLQFQSNRGPFRTHKDGGKIGFHEDNRRVFCCPGYSFKMLHGSYVIDYFWWVCSKENSLTSHHKRVLIRGLIKIDLIQQGKAGRDRCSFCFQSVTRADVHSVDISRKSC